MNIPLPRLLGPVLALGLVASSVRMLHGMGLAVYAEGVDALADAQALAQCGVDGYTGPAARQKAL